MAGELCEDKLRNLLSSSYCYSDVSSSNPTVQTHLENNQIQGFESNSQIFNLTTSMEMIGFSRNLQQQQTDTSSTSVMWKSGGSGGGGGGGGGYNIQQEQEQQMIQDVFLTKSSNLHHQWQFQLKNSKYLEPAQQLLNEFCSLGTKQTDQLQRKESQKTRQWDSDSKIQFLYSLEFIELQKRKTKLFSKLEEVERKYRHYCNQMKAVISPFEEVAGGSAAAEYSALASKAMSRHFRCLKDGIVAQIQAIKKAMGERDHHVATGTTKGETPRLRILDQNLRKHRAVQQMNFMETHPWRPQRGLPERSVSVLRAWLFEHFLHPYPSDVDKHMLARQTGLSRSQVSNWFINARVRLWKPMVEEMYLEETKDQENNNAMGSSDTDLEEDNINQNLCLVDQKPRSDQLLRIDSECLSSIISNSNRSNRSLEDTKKIYTQQPQHNFGVFGGEELDFSSYNHHTGGGVSYRNDQNQNLYGGGGGGGVSLTLGLQQHGENGVSLAFSSASQRSLFYPRDDIDDDCQPVEYSLLDGEGQNLPYRNLMGAQFLHDLAG